jgi:hypothetical protein
MIEQQTKKGDRMRTAGTFQDVFEAVRDESDGLPHNPVIRREGDRWMLESALIPTDGDFEQPLDDFLSWWHEGLTDPDYIPAESDIAAYVAACFASEQE